MQVNMFSDIVSSTDEAIDLIRKNTDSSSTAECLILFTTGDDIEPESVFRGIRESHPDLMIYGGHTIGIFTENILTYSENAICGIFLYNCEILSHFSCNLSQDLSTGGKECGDKFSAHSEPGNILLLYDSVCSRNEKSDDIRINSSAKILSGILSSIINKESIFGAGLVKNFSFDNSVIFCGDKCGYDCLCALNFPDLAFHTKIMHGCTPVSGYYHRITDCSDDIIREIDGRPATEVIDEIFGNTEWQSEIPISLLTIGINKGKKYTPFKEENFINRLILSTMPGSKSIRMFESDLKTGDEFIFMKRKHASMFHSVKKNTTQAIRELKSSDKIPLFAFVFDCAGRTKKQSFTDKEESSIAIKILKNENIPIIGLYTGVEIAPIKDHSRGLDWTSVLAIAYEKK
ncbi:MAG: FIST N-terminal domain-containing protein [Candidatus Muiribacteriaceae bacterium]